MPFFCAVPTNLAARPERRAHAAVGRPVLHREPRAEQVDRAQEEPVLQGQAPAQRRRRSTTTIGNSLDATYLRVQQGATDYAAGGIPPASYAEAAQKYGINKGQFWVKPQLGDVVPRVQHDRAASSRSNVRRCAKAVNYAIDRSAMLAQGGYLAGKRTDQILPPGMAGFRDAEPVPAQGPNIATAKKLARRPTSATATVVLYTSNRGACSAARRRSSSST